MRRQEFYRNFVQNVLDGMKFGTWFIKVSQKKAFKALLREDLVHFERVVPSFMSFQDIKRPQYNIFTKK